MEDEIQVETLQGPDQPGPQPAFQPEAPLSEQAVREAVMRAEKEGNDPTELRLSEVQGPNPPQAKPVEVPEKFKTPTGEVDVEKLKASTKQLDEAIQQKDQKLAEVQKSVEDYLQEYRAKEQKYREMPNPEKIAAKLPTPAPTTEDRPQVMTDQQLREIIARDYQADPIATTAQLIQIAIEKRLQPYEKERQDNSIRDNIRTLAEKDPRILQPEIFKAINQKLEQDPDLRTRKNPHRAAWLEVKEELRLGEPTAVQAQPSKPSSPILGGGTPPPTPAASSGVTAQTLQAAINQVNPKDPKQMEALDRAAKEFFDRAFR